MSKDMCPIKRRQTKKCLSSGIPRFQPWEDVNLRAKQPKRGAVAAEKGYIEVNNYPRGDKAVITYTENGMQETIELGNTASALDYEIMDMQEYVLHDRKAGLNNLRQVRDVMKTLTEIRRQWGMLYPFE